MKRFRDLQFKPMNHKLNAYNATLNLGALTISVGYGDGLYGSGPAYDTYEVSVYNPVTDDTTPLGADDDVLGWQHRSDIDQLMIDIQQTPGFEQNCNDLNRGQDNKCFDNISRMKDDTIDL